MNYYVGYPLAPGWALVGEVSLCYWEMLAQQPMTFFGGTA